MPLQAGHRNKVAYIFTKEDGSEQQITYGQLLDLVGKIGNGLKSLGVNKIKSELRGQAR